MATLVLLALLSLLARVVFRRLWIVEARAEDGRRLRWRVVGWRASDATVQEVAQQLQAGIVPPASDA